ncbi:MAG: PQQ-binding-like beta-propeller repeat protein, partial [Planctomycetes bacterium]|nr:PQQ-binding-like beta-propeller repeat protein [Planctomycetota bacterium]
EAMLSLAADAAARGARDEAAALLDLFAEDYPGLREPEEIEQLRPDPGDAAPPGPVETFRLAELPPRAAAAPAGEGEEHAAADPSSADAAPSAAAEGARASPARGVYREVFWHAIDEGVLAATAPGSDPLPAILAVRASKLRLIDRAGDIIVERELPGFPDLEEIKASLQSHIEEPFVAHLRDGILVLFTAGGCYAFAMDPPADGVEAVDAAAFRLRWLSPYPHALEKYRQSSRMGWGTISVESGSNLFPLVFFEGDGDPKILLAGGELLRIDRVTGKLVWRLAPETESQVIGDPSVEGGWRPLSRIEVASSAPPGLLRYTLPGEASGQRGKVELLRAPEAARRGAVIEGIARVFQGAKLVVASADGGRPLWSRAAGASLVRAESALVWTSVEGTLEARSLRSGRVRREIELPGRSRVVALFDDPRVDGGGWTIAATGGPGAVLSSYSSRAQTGSELHLIRLDAQKRKMWEVEIASGPVTYDGSRLVLEDGRWLFALNEQERESEKWYTRVVAVSPEDGFVETWLTAKISGKGTGQPARLATAAGGIALGNSEGFGWFTTDGESMEEAAGGGDVR